MKNFSAENIIITIVLFVSVLSFFIFGLFHLGKFETTDEHLWKYGRIGQYWDALAEKDWKKTYINDKPGVTVALISGIGLISEPDPDANQYLIDTSGSQTGLFEKYDYQQTEITNFRFRLPILIFASLSLLLFFYLALKAFSSKWIALFSTMLAATNPILLGMSQIINPDSFFWIFGGLSTLSYIALLNTNKKKFIVICGALTGMALLSKYTTFTLFLFYALALFAKLVFQKPEEAKKINWRIILQRLGELLAIFLISITVFSVLLPAVFVKPEYLLKGIGQFFNWKSISLFAVIGMSFAMIAIYAKDFFGQIFVFLAKHRNVLIIFSCAAFSLLLSISLINVWTGQHIAPVDALRDAAYANEPKEFNFKPLIGKDDNEILKNGKLFLMEAYPFIFSLSPLIIISILFLTYLSLRKKLPDEVSYPLTAIFLFSLAYFASTIFAGVVTNVRYSIVLYPLFAIVGALALIEAGKIFRFDDKKIPTTISIIILAYGLLIFLTMKPFYFSYTNFLLPEKYTVHDSWGHGSYEAAQYLNSLPEAEKLIIWSNSDTVCRFFKGKCLRSRKIDLAKVTPDYFVVSKRGALKTSNRFVLLNNPDETKSSDYYFDNMEELSTWELFIDNRKDNFIRVIKYEK